MAAPPHSALRARRQWRGAAPLTLVAAVALVLAACDPSAQRSQDDAPVRSQSSLLAGAPGWSMPASLTSARGSHTATLLPSGRVLVVGGADTSSPLASAELFDPATGSWASSAGSLSQARRDHTATLLPSGKVLVVGGEGPSGTLAGAELFDPATGSWAPTGSLSQARKNHTATLLPSGKVLVAGGADTSGPLASAELFDPATGSCGSTGSLVQGRSDASATLLPSGKVLVAGGAGSSAPLTSAELFDPATGSWASSLSLSQARALHTATLLPSGRVLVAGGAGPSGVLTSAELFDPGAGSWAPTGGFASVQERSNASATLLPSGKVLLAAGDGYNFPLSSSQLYDPATGSWTATGSLAQSRSHQTATLLSSGKVLVTGGFYGYSNYRDSAELYDPATGSWGITSPLTVGRACHTATLLPSGKVLVAGGFGYSGYLNSAELFDPATGSWAPTGSLTQGRACHTATLLSSGKVLVVGNIHYDGKPATAELYDPATGLWTATGTLARAHSEHTATLLPSGKVLVAGGYGGPTAADWASAELYDPATGSWSATASMIQGRRNHSATLLPSGKVLVVGGGNPNDSLATAELYDPATGSWSATGSLTHRRVYHAVSLLASGKVLVTGGIFSNSSEVYDETGANPAWRPGIAGVSASAPLTPGSAFTVNGSLMRGVSEASGGGSRSSPTDFPFLTLLDLGSDRLIALPSQDFSSTHVTSSVPLIPPGQYLLSLTVNGLSSGKVIDIAAAQDAVPPSVTLTAPSEGQTLKGTVTLSAAAFDNIAVTRVEFYAGSILVGTDTAPPFHFSWNTRTGPNGPYLLTAKAYDAEEQSATSPGVSVTLDNDFILPSVAFSSPEEGATVTGTRPVTVVATDNLGVARVELYEGTTPLGTKTASPYGFSWDSRTGSNGPRTLTAKAYDTEGNIAVATVTVTADNEFIPPTVELIAPSEGQTLSGTIVLTATASDASGISKVAFYVGPVLVGTDNTAPYSFSFNTRSQTNGAKVLTAKAYDAVDNVGTSAPVNVTFDNDFTTPTVALTAPDEGATLKGTVTLSATAADNIAVDRVEFYDGFTLLGTDTSSPYSFSWDTRTASNGAHQLQARAYDAEGLSAASSWVNVTLDNDLLSPSVAISAPAAGATVTGNVNVSATATDNLGVIRVEFYDGDTLVVTDTSSPYGFLWNSRTGSNGSRTLTAKAHDAAGNTAVATVTVTANNDLLAPTVTLTAPAEGQTLSGTVVLTATASDDRAVSKVVFFIDTTQVGTDTAAPYSFSYNTRSLTNGTKVITAKAYDAVNNVGTSVPVNVTIDNDFTPPTVALTAPAEGQTLTGTVVFSATASDDRAVSKVVFFVGTTQVGTDTTAPFSFSYNTRALPNGAKVITAKAYDAVNNVGTSAPVNVTFDNDFTPPTTSITSPSSGATVSGVARIDVIATDEDGTVTKVDFYQGTAYLGTDTTAPYSWDWDTTKAPIGSVTLKTRAWNAAGYSAYSAGVTVTVTR